MPIWDYLIYSDAKKKPMKHSALGILLLTISSSMRISDTLKRLMQHTKEAIKEKDPFSPKMDAVIRLCKSDIAIAPECKKGFLLDKNLASLPNYPAFTRLAIIYQKRKQYDQAIAICKAAIDLGFTSSPCDGGMKGRLKKLQEKQSKG